MTEYSKVVEDFLHEKINLATHMVKSPACKFQQRYLENPVQ